jgi:FkbM family methyltransferase
MKFISYAQNCEDVILNRAFRGRNRGFYIDAGAADPVGHSVTKAFSDRGWCGINIEPSQSYYEQLQDDRPRDINLNVGLSNEPGHLPLYEFPGSPGLSTFKPAFRDKWQRLHGLPFVEKIVPVMTLAQVCEQYADEPIDFIKIDVEGLETEVVAGADWTRFRPKIVLIEGPRKLHQEHLFNANYLHATFDGVNHYFVSQEASALIPILATPLSLVIDDFELYETVCERTGHQDGIRNVAEAHRRIDQIEAALFEEKRRAQELESELANARRELDDRVVELAETAAIRDETDVKLVEVLGNLHTQNARYETLHAEVAPLIEVSRILRKVNGSIGHPAHRFRRMSDRLRHLTRSTNGSQN